MRIVSRKIVTDHTLSPTGRAAEAALLGWLDVVGAATWADLDALRVTYPHVETRDQLVAFALRPNVRLVAGVAFRPGVVRIRQIRADGWPKPAKEKHVPTANLLPDSYYRLVRAFPLRPLASADDLAAAQAALDRAFAEEGDAGIDAYVEVLATLIDEYERTVHPTAAEPWQLVAHLLEARHIARESLAQQTRINLATLASILDEHKPITPATAAKLGPFFGVPMELFLRGPA